MIWRGMRYVFYMVPVLGFIAKQLILERTPLNEIRTNYLLDKANAHERAGFLDQALKTYKKLLRSNRKGIPALLNLGGLYYRKGMYEAALPYYERVIRLNPKHYQGHYWLAMCYVKLGRHYAAINTLEEVIEFLPTFKDALNLLGECYERIGEGAKAEHYYLKAIGADPKGVIIQGGVLKPPVPEKSQRETERIKH